MLLARDRPLLSFCIIWSSFIRFSVAVFYVLAIFSFSIGTWILSKLVEYYSFIVFVDVVLILITATVIRIFDSFFILRYSPLLWGFPYCYHPLTASNIFLKSIQIIYCIMLKLQTKTDLSQMKIYLYVSILFYLYNL